MGEVRCFGCGALVPDIGGPVHGCMLAAPGCWSLYTGLEDWKTGLSGRPGIDAAQQMIDSYTVQHATGTDRLGRLSVAVHLMSLCAALEHDVPGTGLRRLLGSWAHRPGGYPVLEPRPAVYAITVRDVADADASARAGVVRLWAEMTWSAWSDHHEQVRAWLAWPTHPGFGWPR
ncbi:MAG TPA: DUF5946 family protein [Streptosporangiaceae bacterium]|nr:DUF5946 family protein [Streptosporangiaceae bacterium]